MAAVAIWSELLGSGMINSPGKMGAQTEIVIPSNLTAAVFKPLGQPGLDCDCTAFSTGGVTPGVGEGNPSSKVGAGTGLVEVGAGVSTASSCVASGVARVSVRAAAVSVTGKVAVGVAAATSWARAPAVGIKAAMSIADSRMVQKK